MEKTEQPSNRETEKPRTPSHLLTFSPSHLDSALSTQHSALIQEGALFVADAHYPHHGDDFLALLRALESGEIQAPQLFLMGDIFDLLFSCGDYIRSFSAEAIGILQRLSKGMEMHYFEGNHDFCLGRLFPDMHVYPRSLQPVAMRLGERKVMLSHGDRYDTGLGYEIYTFFLRSCRAMCLLLPWERSLIDPQMRRLAKKHICRDFPEFEAKAERIAAHYGADTDLIVEGHFHQGRRIGRYVSLPSLACQQKVGVLREGEIEFVETERL